MTRFLLVAALSIFIFGCDAMGDDCDTGRKKLGSGGVDQQIGSVGTSGQSNARVTA